MATAFGTGAVPEAAVPGRLAETAAPAGAGVARRSLPATLLGCALAYAAFSHGAFYRPQLLTFAGLLTGAAVLAARGDRAAWRGVPVAAAAFAAWALVSAALGGDVTGAGGTVAVTVCVAAAYTVVRHTGRAEREVVASSLVAVGCCVALLGWLGVVLRVVPLSLVDQRLWRAASSITYANGTAGLLVPVALLALARLAARPASRAHALAATVLLTGVAATLSRAGYLALALGLAVLLARNGAARTLRAGWPAALGAAVAFAGLLPTMPADAPARPLLAVAALAGGLVVATVRLPARQVVAGTLAAAVLAVAFGAGAPVATAAGRVGAVRVTAASPDRAGEWAATWRVAREHPVTGVGPGRLVIGWTHADGRLMRANFTHNEYLEVLAETGAVGLALVLALVATAARGLRRRGAGDADRAPELAAGAAAAFAALLVHSAFDFVWHIPVVPVAGFVLLALAGPNRKVQQ